MDKPDLDRLFDLVLKNSTTCDALLDPTGKVYRCNQAYADLLGFSCEEIEGKPHTLFVPEEDQVRERDSLNKLLHRKIVSLNFRSSRQLKNGQTIQVDITTISFTDPSGKVSYILKRVEDVNTLLPEEEQEKNQQLYLKTIMEEMPMNIYFKDLESRFLLVSKNNIKFLGGKTMDDIRGKTDYDFFQPVHADVCMKDEQYIIQTGNNLMKEEREVHKDGSVTWVLTTKSALKDIHGKIIGTYGISRDITPLKLAEAETKQVNKMLEEKNIKLEETINELSRTQNKLIFAEKMAALGNLIGGIAHEINTPLGAIKASSSNIQEVVEKINIDLPWLINHTTPEEINWLFKLIYQADARDLSVFSREERQRKRELTQLLEDNKIENAPAIADTIVSLRLTMADKDLMQLLSLPNAQNLLQMLKVLFSLKRNANNIEVSVGKASNVVSALKNYIYKNSQGKFEATNLVDTINTVLILTANMIKRQKTEIVTKFDRIPLVLCRQDEMCQVWTNIITNAIQAMGEGGTLEIGTRMHGMNQIQIWFKDNGAGIPDHIKPRIFELYFTTKTKGVGTGMGLDISRQIIESHQGKLYFESEVGVGTTFFIEMPIQPESQKK